MGIIRGRSKGIVHIRKEDGSIWESETRLTNSPTPVEGIDNFIYKEDRNNPSSPTSYVRSGAKSPVPSRPGNTGGGRVGKSGDSERRA